MLVLNGADEPFPKRKRLGVRIVDAENPDTLRDPELGDVTHRLPYRRGRRGIEIQIDDVLILFRRVFRIANRAIRAEGEPLGMLGDPRMVWCALDGEVERHFHAAVATGGNKGPKVAQRPKLGVDGIVTSEPAADCVGASGITRRRNKRVVFAFAVLFADRMDRDEINGVKTHRCNVIETGDAILEACASPLDGTLRPRKHLVPGRKARLLPVDHELKLAVEAADMRAWSPFAHERLDFVG